MSKVRQHPLWATAAVLTLLTFGCLGYHVLARRPGAAAPPPEGTASDWRQAQEALAAQDFLLAKTHLSRCLESWPLDGEAHFLMARSCRRSGDAAGWQLHLERTAVLQWPTEDIQFEALLMKAQSGDVRSVEQTLLGYLTSRPADEVLIVEALVKGYLEMHRLKDVFHWTALWMERYPNDPLPWLYRGRACYLNQTPARAADDFARALERKPDHTEARLRLANMLMIEAHFQEALAHFERYLQVDAGDPTALFGVANCRFSLGRMADARAALTNLFARHKEHPAGTFLWAKLELAEGTPEEAVKWLKRADALAPNKQDIIHNLVLTFRQLGKLEESRAYERKLEDLNLQLTRLEALTKKIKDEPDNTALRYEAGALCLRLARAQEAARWFQSVLRLDPGHRRSQQLLADYDRDRGVPPDGPQD